MNIMFRTGTIRLLLSIVSLLVALTAMAPWLHAAEPATLGSAGGKTGFIFAVSWQPGFCETQPRRKECLSQTPDRFDATHFSLHGLWPVDKRFCNVSADLRQLDKAGDWSKLPPPALSSETATRLAVAMPGTQSSFERHQWLQSGTCQAGSAQDYFSIQLRLLDELNGSAVQTLFTERLAGEVTEAEVKEAFDTSFGPGAGDRVRMRCQKAGKRMVVTGLTIGLGAELAGNARLSPLIHAAAATDFKCQKGIADAAGRT